MMQFCRSRFWLFLLFLVTISVAVGSPVLAQTATSIEDVQGFVNSLWLVVAGALVFFMNAGFALLEAGSCSRKSLINVLAKNLVVFCIATLAFWLLGFNLMFGDGATFPGNQPITCPIPAGAEVFSYRGNLGLFELSLPQQGNPLGFPATGFSCLKETIWPNRSFAAIFFFQLVFAGTSATIVSGAVAERIKFNAFCFFSFFLVLLIYPALGHWVWGPFGWLYQMDFRDFAGSTVVHSVGGTAALVGAFILGPRWTRRFNRHEEGYDPQNEIIIKGIRYAEPDEEYKSNLTKAHNPGFVTIGAFILWLGWIGFNGGSTTDLSYVGHIVVTTLIAAAAGGLTAITTIQFFSRQDPSLGNFINGILGGLVAITASSAYVGIVASLIIGVASGIIVVISEIIILPIWCKIDDPVGAIPVHLFCGGWGTIAVGIFAETNSSVYGVEINNLSDKLRIIGIQAFGWGLIVILTAVCSWLLWVGFGLLIFQFDSLNKTLEINPNLRRSALEKFLVPLRARHGIRLAVRDEYTGTYPMFIDPARQGREEQLQRIMTRINY